MAKDKSSKSPEKKETQTPKQETQKSTKKQTQQKKSGLGFAPIFAILVLAGAIFLGYQNQDLVKKILGNSTASGSTEVTYEEEVAVLTNSNFQPLISSRKFVLVEFYATWCGHCKKLAPEYAKAAQILKNAGADVVIAKLEATENRDVADKFDVKGYPTLRWFENGKDVEYDGGRTTATIVNWVNKKLGNVSTEIKSAEQLERFLSDNNVAVVYFANQQSGANWDQFIATASTFDKVSYAHVLDAQIAQQNKASLGQLVVFKQFDDNRADFSGDFTSENIIEFIGQHRVPTAFEFDDAAIELVFQSQLKTLIIFHDEQEKSQKAREIFDKLAVANKGKGLNYCYSRPTDKSGHYNKLAEFLGSDIQNAPAITILDTSAGLKKFHFSGEVTEESLQKFVSDFESNSLVANLKSEEIPEQTGDLLVLVGKSFQQEVIESDRDVLVKFYAPWCGHCKSMAPAYEEAASVVKTGSNGKVVLAKIDSTQNEVSGVEVTGFPTIKFFKANDKANPIDFTGERTADGIVSWLSDNNSQGWKQE